MTRIVLLALLGFASATAHARDLEGWIFSTSGDPVAGATVEIHRMEGSRARWERLLSPTPARSPVATATTDAKGRFASSDLPQSILELVVLHDGFAPAQSAVAPDEETITLALSAAKAKEGRVLAGGKGVAGARVVWTGMGDVELLVTTDAGGRYRVPDPALWAHQVVVLHPDFAPLRGDRGAESLTHHLGRGFPLRGRVVDEGGKPVAGARLEVDEIPSGVSGEDGTFSVPHAPPEARVIAARTSSHAGSVRPAPGELAIVAGPARRITGRVTVRQGDGAPVPLPGARVTIHPFGEEFVGPLGVVAGDDGRYVAEGLPPGRYGVFFAGWPDARFRPAAAASMHADVASAPVELRTRVEASVDIPLLGVPTVWGRVIDAGGDPVFGAAVAVVGAGIPDMHLGPGEQRHRTDPNGRYAIPAPHLERTPLEVVVMRPGYSTVRSEAFRLENADRRVDVTLPRFVAIEGNVVDTSTREPVPGAVITFAGTGSSRGDMIEGMSAIAAHNPSRTVTADSRGRFVLHLEPGAYDFGADAPGFQDALVRDRRITTGTRAIEIPLEPGFAITGRVSRDGVGVPGVQVMIAQRGRFVPPVNTEGDGSFVIPDLARGTYRLEIAKWDEMVQETAEVSAPGSVTIDLPPAGTLRGRVVDAVTREPVPGFALMIASSSSIERSERRRRGVEAMHRGPMAPDGRFEAIVPAGVYTVVASAGGYLGSEPREVRIAAREALEIEIALDRGLTVTGRIVDEQGAPVADANVYFAFESEADPRRAAMHEPRVAPANAMTDERGAFSVSGLAEGAAIVHVRKDGFLPIQRNVPLSAATRLDLTLSRGISLHGTVVRNGRPVGGVHVNASSAILGAEHQSALTDDAGRFVLRGLVPAHYTLMAGDPERGFAEKKNVDVSRERDVVIELQERSTGVVWGRVTGAGATSVRPTVSVYGDRGGTEAAVDAAGNFRIENAPAGTARIRAHVTGDGFHTASEERVIDVPAGGELRVDLDLAPSITIRGRVTRDGIPIARANVVFSSARGGVASATTGEDGAYEAGLQLSGTYRLFVHSEEMMDVRYETAREIRTSGALDIDIRDRRIEGTVIDGVTSQPIAGALVSLGVEDTPHAIAETLTDAAGRFVLPTAVSGRHELFASAQGYAHDSRTIDLAAAVSHVVFVLTPAAELRVSVVEASTGLPLDAWVQIAGANGMALPVRPNRSADGRTFTLSVAPGRYRLTATAGNYGSKTVEVSAPGSVEIGLAPGGDLLIESPVAGRVRLTGPSGVPVAICCEPAAAEIHGALTVGSLDPGTYAIELLDARGRAIARTTALVHPGALTRVRISP